MSRVRVHNFAISLDGYGTGAGQTRDAPFGHAGERLHEWMFATRWWEPGGSGGVDDVFARQHEPGIGAEIMGAGKFGYPGWHEDPETTFHFLDAAPAAALATARAAALRVAAGRAAVELMGTVVGVRSGNVRGQSGSYPRRGID